MTVDVVAYEKAILSGLPPPVFLDFPASHSHSDSSCQALSGGERGREREREDERSA